MYDITTSTIPTESKHQTVYIIRSVVVKLYTAQGRVLRIISLHRHVS